MPRKSTEVQGALNTAKIGEVEKDVQGLATRFDRHLEIYAQNGKELGALKVSVGQVHESLQDLTLAVQGLSDKCASKDELKRYVTKDTFAPVKAIAYGIIGTTGFAVLAAILGTVLASVSS